MSFDQLDQVFLGHEKRESSFEDFKRTAIKIEEAADGLNENPTPSQSPSTMPFLAEPETHSDQENIDPSDEENADNDRASEIIQKAVKSVHEDYDHEYRRRRKLRSKHRSATTQQTTSTSTSPQLTPDLTFDSSDDDAVPTTDDQDTAVTDQSDNVLEVTTPENIQSALKKAKKSRKNTSIDSIVHETRPGLRIRTAAQQAPYMADRLAYQMTKASGRTASQEQVEEHLKRGMQTPMIRTVPTSKKRRRNHSVEIENDEDNSSLTSNSASSKEASNEYKLQHTTLRITVAGSPDGGMEVALARFADLASLMSFINQRWGRVKHSTVDHLTCQRPWKGRDSDVAIYRGWDDQYMVIVDSVLQAPIWQKKSTSLRTLDVKVVVTLIDNETTP